MNKLLVISYYFPPVGGAGVQRIQKFVRYLPTEGFLPAVIAGPALTQGRWTPGDPTLLTDIPRDVTVYRANGAVPQPVNKWERRFQGIFGLPSPFSNWWVKTVNELAINEAGKVDLILATMPPFETAIAAELTSRRLGVPWVADLRDPWAVDEIQVYPSWFHRKRELAKMEQVLSTAAIIIMNTPEAVKSLRKAFPQFKSKTVVCISNGFDREDFEENILSRNDIKFRIVHAGSLLTDAGLQLRRQKIQKLLGGVGTDVDILTRSPAFMVKALAKWCQEHPEVRKDLDIVFAGNASTADQAVTSALSSQVRFLGYVSHADSLALIRTADLLFLPMHNMPAGIRSKTAPGKMYEYMATGRPILAAVPDGDARDFLDQCGSAFLCRPDDVTGMVDIFRRLYRAWKSNEPQPAWNRAFVDQFERRTLTHKLAEVLHSQFDELFVGRLAQETISSK